MTLIVEYCGERLQPGEAPFVIGRDADLHIDENPFLHRRFLTISQTSGMWMLTNVGSQLSATVSDGDSRMEAFLSPGASIPLVFQRTVVRFAAGPTSYEFVVLNDSPFFAGPAEAEPVGGETTVGVTRMTPDQVLLVLALAEPVLRGEGRASVSIPSLAMASERLGWTTTKFNRKLDNVCQKLTKLGVRGLHGGPEKLASNRRARLVEYAIATRLVQFRDLEMLDTMVSDSET
jgi:hypothetical protein